jgi:hypothetical protein
MKLIFIVVALSILSVAFSFRALPMRPSMRATPLKMLDFASSLQVADAMEMNTQTYIALAVVTLLPSLAFVKFVGDAADTSRDKLSEETKANFKRSMMSQPGDNLALPTSEEEALKKAVAKAYMQDKDVDVAVLEEKLRKRAQWRKEVLAQQKQGAVDIEDEDGW